MSNKNTIIFFLVIVTLLLFAYNYGIFDYQDITRLYSFQEWIEGWGWLAPFFFIVIYSLATLLFLPNPFFMIVAGISFGSFWGVIFVSIAFVAGASLSFIISRYFARDFFKDWLDKKDMMDKIYGWFDIYGWKVLILTRSTPLIPINLQNYAYGLTDISYILYITISWLVTLPKIILLTATSGLILEEGFSFGIYSKVILMVLIIIIVLHLLTYKFIKSNKRRDDK